MADTVSSPVSETPEPRPSEPIDAGDLAGAVRALLTAWDGPFDVPAWEAALSNARYCVMWWDALTTTGSAGGA